MERFVCCSCEKQGLPSFFVSKRAVRIHMGKSKMCKGGEYKRITVMIRPGDVIAGGSGGMGHVLLHSISHQVYTCPIPRIYLVYAEKKSYTRYMLGIY